MPLQIRRGLEAERTQITPTNGLVEGELLYVTDQKKLYIGSGSSGEHQGVVITGYNDLDAKDAAAAIFEDGEHTGISFTYDDETKALNAVVDLSAFDGPIVADALKGSVFADDSGILVDAIGKKFYGDLNGSVFSDNSSLMVDAVSNRIIADSIESELITTNGLVLQTNEIDVQLVEFNQSHNDATGRSSLVFRRTRGTDETPLNVASGDIVSSIIASAKIEDGFLPIAEIRSRVQGTPSTSAASGAIDFLTSNSLGALTNVMSLNSDGSAAINIETYSSTASVASFLQQHDTVDARAFILGRARGTRIAPAPVVANDVLTKLNANAFDGTSYVLSSQIRAIVDPDATISTGAVAGRLDVLLNGNDGFVRSRIEIDSTKTVHYNQFWGQTVVPTGLVINLLANTSTVSDGARSMMRRSRGTFTAPTTVVNGDSLFRLGWGGHDGTAYRDTAFITGVVANTVSTSVVPTKLTVSTTNSIGTLATALEITEEQVLKVNTVASLSTTSVDFNSAVKLVTFADATARDAAISVPAAGMMVYITATGKFQGYNGLTSTWNDLN
jgi:hypothetical protein